MHNSFLIPDESAQSSRFSVGGDLSEGALFSPGSEAQKRPNLSGDWQNRAAGPAEIQRSLSADRSPLARFKRPHKAIKTGSSVRQSTLPFKPVFLLKICEMLNDFVIKANKGMRRSGRVCLFERQSRLSRLVRTSSVEPYREPSVRASTQITALGRTTGVEPNAAAFLRVPLYALSMGYCEKKEI